MQGIYADTRGRGTCSHSRHIGGRRGKSVNFRDARGVSALCHGRRPGRAGCVVACCVTRSGLKVQPAHLAVNTCPHEGHACSADVRLEGHVPSKSLPHAGHSSGERNVIFTRRTRCSTPRGYAPLPCPSRSPNGLLMARLPAGSAPSWCVDLSWRLVPHTAAFCADTT